MQDDLDLLLDIDGAKADMEYWCKYSWLTIGQLTLLSFGLNPTIIDFECIRRRRYDSFFSDYLEINPHYLLIRKRDFLHRICHQKQIC